MEHEFNYWAPKSTGRGWICFKSSPSPPPAPDYVGAAKATATGSLDAAKQAAAANRVNQITPYGNLTYTQAQGTFDQAGYDAAMKAYTDQQASAASTPGGLRTMFNKGGLSAPNREDFSKDGAWTANTELSPQQQALMDQQTRTSQGLGNLQDAATGRVASMMGAAPPGTYDPTRSTNNAAELINMRLAPQQKRDRATLDNQLANQGIMRGSEAYDNAQDQIGRQQNDARQQAELQGISLGQGQQAQQYAQESVNRNLPLNELNAIRTGSQVTNPSFNGNTPQQSVAQGANVAGAVQGQSAYNQGIYNADVSTTNSNNAAGASVAAMAMYMM